MEDLISTKPKGAEALEKSTTQIPEGGEGVEFGESGAAYADSELQVPNLRTISKYLSTRIQISLNFETAGRYVSGGGGAGSAITFSSGSGSGPVKLEPGTDTGGYYGVWLNYGLAANFALFDLASSFSTIVHIPVFSASNTKNCYVIFGAAAADIATILKHYGFIIRNNNGVKELHITFHNGTTQTTRQIVYDVPTLTDPIRLSARFIPSNRVEFYVNGKLVYTDTRAHLLPSGNPGDSYNRLFMVTQVSSAGTTNNVVHVGPSSVELSLV